MRFVDLQRYQYTVPPALIATTPAHPRDAAKLLVYTTATNTLTIDTFRHLAHYLPPRARLVFNNTKVVPLRLVATKPTGGRAVITLLLNEWRSSSPVVRGLADRALQVGQRLTVARGVSLTVTGQNEAVFVFRLNFAPQKLFSILERYGQTPLPPYLKHPSLSERQLRTRYQSVLAQTPASTAAPTASLHFTPRLLRALQQHGCTHSLVTLHVGLGTFGTLAPEHFSTQRLFAERYTISQRTARDITTNRQNHQPVIAVGTTVVRTLESAATQHRGQWGVRAGVGSTKLFITPPYQFQIVDGLVTNFHWPRSSLMLLVDAFLRHKHSPRGILDLYRYARRHQFRFYSFGDGMLIL